MNITNQTRSPRVLWGDKNVNQLPVICLALYFQGLQLYFYLTGLIDFKPVWLTGSYQIILLAISCYGLVKNRENRQKIIALGGIEICYIAFYFLFLVDIVFLKTISSDKIPEFALIYFTTYTCSLLIARALSLNQIKLFIAVSNFISAIACLLLVLQFFAGSASLVGGGVRLSTGTSGNPINTGYLGAYCAVTALILLLANPRKKIYRKIYYLIGIAVGLYVTILATTRSAFIYFFISAAIVILAKVWLSISGNRKGINFKKLFRTSSILFLGLMFVLSLSAITFPHIFVTGSESLIANVAERLSRLDTILQILSSDKISSIDRSVAERVSFYDNAWEIFLNNPIYGGGVYAAGTVHNAFLQSATELGILGILTFTLPCIHLGVFCLKRFWQVGCNRQFFDARNDDWLVSIYCWALFLNALCIWLFHGDPYRGYLSPLIAGILIAYSKTRIGEYE